MSTEKKTWIGGVIAAIVSIFHKAENIADEILKQADKFVNAIKALEESQVGQFIETTLESLFPASSGLVSAGQLWLAKISTLITNTESELAKSDEDKIKDLVNYLSKLKGADPVLYAGLLNTLSAAYQQFLSSNTGVTALTIPMSLAAAQPAHDETLGTTE